jgi:membrane-bound lytic murein transglycosylase D
METQLPTISDTIHVNKDLHLQQVASVCNIDIEQLRSLNPQYKKDLIPGNSKVYALRLPNNMATTFIEREDSIYAFDAKKYLTKRRTVAVNDGSKNTKGAKYHKIKQGDTLGGIAARYGVSVRQIRNLNGIKGNNIRAGKTIRVR